MHVFHSTNLPKNTPRNTFLVVQQLLWLEPHCFLFMDETAHGYTFLNVGTLQELEEAGRQRFAKCTVLPAVYFGEKTRATPQVCRERRDRGEGRRTWGV
jgi:hypothetical protein